MRHLKKILIFGILVISCAFFYVIVDANANKAKAITSQYTGFSENQTAFLNGYYDDFINKHSNDVLKNDDEIFINPTTSFEFTRNSDNLSEVDPTIESIGGLDSLRIPETGNISFNVEVSKAGLYNIKLNYFCESTRSTNITRGIMINGEYQFSESEIFTLTRIWQDEYDISTHHVSGKHDIKPSQIEKLRWNEMPIRDTDGYYEGVAYNFYFQEGLNTITLIEDKEPFYLNKITLYHEKELPTYKEVESLYQKNNLKRYDKEPITLQGESAYEKSSTILSPVANWSSYKVDPYVKFKTIYNTIGGTTWRVSGDWISWNLQVEEDGLYALTFKVLQNYSRGMYSTRRLYLNGEVPFKECENIMFSYDSDWQNVTLGDDEGVYYFYLKANQDNIITLEATIGVYNKIVKETKDIINRLNKIYREVVMIAGVNPEKHQNYFLSERIEGLWDIIEGLQNDLQSCIDMIVQIAGSRSSLVSSFDRTLYQMKKFMNSESNILTGISELDDNISSLGTLVMTISEQSLAVDKLYAHKADETLEKPSTNFFQKLWHEIVMLVGSYGANTSLESSVEADGPTITVWIMSGRDQSQLLRQLIDDSFTMQHNINVELKLVTSSVLLPATLTNNGPDVAIGVGQNIPVNWGIRNAVVDLKQFGDFNTFIENFHETSIVPFTFNGKTYALPDTQDFQLTFVRKDIVDELSLDVPKTWDEVEDILPVLQRRYLEYYIPNTKGQLSTVLYSMLIQNGCSLYNEDGSKVLLNDRKAEDAFVRFTKLFSDKGFSISANFQNRFRTGEMPIGIANYSLYNTLAVFAPDIKGQWEFDMFPGTVLENGTVNSLSTSTSTGTIILSQSKEKEASWEFVKWWLGKEAQLGYARGMEAILGAAARYPTANLKAFNELPWSNKERKILNAQRENSKGIPTVPGDYIVGRYIDNAFRAVYNKNINPRDSLFDYTKKINSELERKRKEFGLD